jgi:branched-chain amino acid transport system permease protein
VSVFVQLLVVGISSGASLALLATGLTLIMGVGKFFHVAHGATFFVAATVAVSMLEAGALPLPLILVMCLAVAAAFGLAIDTAVYRPLIARGVRSMLVIIASLGALYAVIYTIALRYGMSPRLAPSHPLDRVFHVKGVTFDSVQIAGVGAFLVLYLATDFMMQRTNLGLAMRACTSSPDMARVMGIDIARVRMAAMAWGSALVAVPAIAISMQTGIEPSVGLFVVLDATVAAIVGGVGSIRGAVIASFLIRILVQEATYVVAVTWQVAIVYGILILIMLVRPTGIAGRRLWESEV